jgi:hypothetical protein
VVHDGATAGGFALARRAEKQRANHSAADFPVTADDVILNVNVSVALNIPVPIYTGRAGAPLTFKVLPGSAVAILTGDTFDGISTLPLVAGMTRTITPYNDGINAGYGVD